METEKSSLLSVPQNIHFNALLRCPVCEGKITCSEMLCTCEQEDFLERANASFTLLDSERVTYNILLRNTGDIINLFHMTPYFWKSSTEARMRIEQLDQLKIQVDVLVRVFQV